MPNWITEGQESSSYTVTLLLASFFHSLSSASYSASLSWYSDSNSSLPNKTHAYAIHFTLLGTSLLTLKPTSVVITIIINFYIYKNKKEQQQHHHLSESNKFQNISRKLATVSTRGGGGVLPYISLIGICHPIGVWFCARSM